MATRCLLGLAALVCLVAWAQAGEFITFPTSGRANKLYVPTGAQSGLPLFVMLHGCTQNPTDFAAGTGMNAWADRLNFYVLYPEQPSSFNANKCWRWFEPGSQERNGDNLAIADMTQSVIAKFNISADKVYVGGLSAGAAQSVLVAAAYPELFAALAVGAGLEWKAATSTTGAYQAMSSGGPDPRQQGVGAYRLEGANARLQKVLVIHGTQDFTVQFVNGKQVVSQWATTLDYILGDGQSRGYLTDVPTTTTKSQVAGGRAYVLYDYADTKPGSGKTQIKFIEVTGMGHAWSGGSTAGSYTDPKGPDASAIMVEWFLNHTAPPTTTTTTTTGGSTTTTTGGSTTSGGGTTTGSTTTGGGNSVTFKAVQRESGYVSIVPSDGYGSQEAKVGDKGMYNADSFRTILSFDTSYLTPGYTVTKAVLRVYRKSLTGTINSISIDIKQGYFGDSANLELADYYSPATASGVATLPVPSSDGAYSEVELPSSVLSYINSQGGNSNARTQLRLSAKTTASLQANTLFLDAGDSATPGNDAALIVHFALDAEEAYY